MRSAGKVRQRWATPRALIQAVESYVGPIDLDACAESHTAKAPRWYGPGSPLGEDGLTAPWVGTTWCNPPYDSIEPWVLRAQDHVRVLPTNRALLLVPPRTEQRWWHRLTDDSLAKLRVLRPRVAFDAPDSIASRAPSFPVVIWELSARLPRLPAAWDWRVSKR